VQWTWGDGPFDTGCLGLSDYDLHAFQKNGESIGWFSGVP
jgi:hypothetical protein